VVRIPEIRVRFVASARIVLNWRRVIRWSGHRGKMILLLLCIQGWVSKLPGCAVAAAAAAGGHGGSRGFLAL
jgi:hypothetical protein